MMQFLRCLSLLLGLLALMPATTLAQTAGAAFSCDGTFYQIRQVGTTSSLFRVNRAAAAYTTEPVNVRTVNGTPTNDLGVLLNGLAYNSGDGYLYALTTPGSGATLPTSIQMYKIGQGGLENLGTVTGLPNIPIATGTIDKAGNYYVSSQNTQAAASDDFNLYRFPLAAGTAAARLTATATRFRNEDNTANADLTFFDFGFSPADNTLYGVNWVGSLFRINQVTGATTIISTTPAANQIVANAVGTLFFDIAGNLFGYNNGDVVAGTGANFYQISTVTGAYTQISTINTASVSDGASCINPSFFVDVVKEVTSVAKTGSAAGIAGREFTIGFQFKVKNTGTQTLERVQVTDFLWSGAAGLTQRNTTFSAVATNLPGSLVVNSLTVANDGTATLAANSTGTTPYTGVSVAAAPIRAGLLTGTQSLTAGQSATINLTVTVTYATVALVPTAVSNNRAYATALGGATSANPGYRLNPAGDIFSPTNGNLSAIDESTNSAVLPAGPNGDVPSPSPIVFQAAIFGNVFEDANYGGGAGRTQVASNGTGVAARVELYSAAGLFLAAATTDATGAYSFVNSQNGVPANTLVASGVYQVRVVSGSVRSERAGSVAGLLPVQTFISNGVTDNANRVGGEAPAQADYGNITTGSLPSTAADATLEIQSITTVTMPAVSGPLVGVDFGFNFSTIVNTNDSGQGSLRQFILNSNALTGEAELAQVYTPATGAITALTTGVETSIFMIPNGTAVAGQRLGLVSQFAATTGGTAATIALVSPLPTVAGTTTALDGSTQTLSTGNSNLAGTTAGAESTGPEVVINFSLLKGLEVTGSNARIAGLGLVNARGDGTANQGAGVFFNGSANSTIADITASGNNSDGVRLLNAAGTTVTGSVLRNNGAAGISLTGSNNGLISLNTIRNNGTDGIVALAGTAGNTFSQNGISGNGDLGIDLSGTATTTGDGVTLNADGKTAASGANGAFNFPVLRQVRINTTGPTPTLEVNGFAPTGSLIEFFLAAADGSGFGEGQLYVGSGTEGSAADRDGRAGSYSGLINGRNQGSQSNANLFTFIIPLTPAQAAFLSAAGAALTATATSATAGVGTSEFSGILGLVAGPLPVELSAFEVQATGADARLSWTTATEKDNDHFDVERRLSTTTSFGKIGTVRGSGTKASASRYGFTDAGVGLLASGPVYYRLRQVDTNGEASYSPVRVVSFAAAPLRLSSLLYPVPAGASVTLNLSGLPAGLRYEVRLSELTGRVASQGQFSGGQQHVLALRGLAAGTYLVSISGTDAQGAPLHLVKRLTKE